MLPADAATHLDALAELAAMRAEVAELRRAPAASAPPVADGPDPSARREALDRAAAQRALDAARRREEAAMTRQRIERKLHEHERRGRDAAPLAAPPASAPGR